ncbi:hypothetical protein D3C83_71620 [compost metagenome]
MRDCGKKCAVSMRSPPDAVRTISFFPSCTRRAWFPSESMKPAFENHTRLISWLGSAPPPPWLSTSGGVWNPRSASKRATICRLV